MIINGQFLRAGKRDNGELIAKLGDAPLQLYPGVCGQPGILAS